MLVVNLKCSAGNPQVTRVSVQQEQFGHVEIELCLVGKWKPTLVSDPAHERSVQLAATLVGH